MDVLTHRQRASTPRLGMESMESNPWNADVFGMVSMTGLWPVYHIISYGHGMGLQVESSQSSIKS